MAYIKSSDLDAEVAGTISDPDSGSRGVLNAALELKQDAASLDAVAAALLNNPASALRGAGNATFARVVSLSTDPAAAAANTVKLNAALAAPGEVIVQTADGSAAWISDTLVAYSYVTVRVNCELKLTAGTARPMWTNASALSVGASVTSFTGPAWDPQNVLIYGTITVPSHALVVDDWVAVQGATASGYNGVFRVTATTATTLTVLLPFAPTVSTATGTMKFFKADRNIKIVGGTANQNGLTQTASSTDYRNCTTLFHGIKGLTLEGITVHDSRRYAFHIGLCSNVRTKNLRVENTISGSDGVHLGGAVFDAVIDGTTGYTGDDFISMTIGDYPGIEITRGDFHDINIINTTCEYTDHELVKMTGSAPFFHKSVTIDGLHGITKIFAVQVYDDTVAGGLVGTQGGTLRIRNVDAYCQMILYMNVTGAFDHVDIDGINFDRVKGNAPSVVSVVGPGTVRLLTVKRVKKINNTIPGAAIVSLSALAGNPTVKTVIVSECDTQTGNPFYVVNNTAGTVGHVSISKSTFVGGYGVYTAGAAAADGTVVVLSDLLVDSMNQVADVARTTTLIIGPGVYVTTNWNANNITQSGSGKKITLVGGPILPFRVKNNLAVSGGGLSEVMGEFALTGANVTNPALGSRFYNTDTAWTSGSGTDKSGMYAYNGTVWQKLWGPA
jgi:hypothetical protein